MVNEKIVPMVWLMLGSFFKEGSHFISKGCPSYEDDMCFDLMMMVVLLGLSPKKYDMM